MDRQKLRDIRYDVEKMRIEAKDNGNMVIAYFLSDILIRCFEIEEIVRDDYFFRDSNSMVRDD